MADINSLYKDLPHVYMLLELIGEGAFSKVYNALNKETGQKIAIKVINKSPMNAQQLGNIDKEISIMRKLDHPNILKLLSYQNNSDSSYCYLFLELIEGGEIFNMIIDYTYFSEDLSKHIIYQLAQAVNYLHNEIGVVHRDIKPENLLFVPIEHKPSTFENFNQVKRRSDDKSKKDEGVFIPGVGGGTIGTIKLADFGLSKVLFNKQTQTPCGTTGYTAPEVIKDNTYSKSVDLWSIGCVLYTLLCGFSPFYDQRHDILMDKISNGKFEFLSPWWDEVSDGAKDLVNHLLTLDPIQRYDVIDLLNHPWLKSLYPETTTMNIYTDLNTELLDNLSLKELISTSQYNKDHLNDDYFNQLYNLQKNVLTPRGKMVSKMITENNKDYFNPTEDDDSSDSFDDPSDDSDGNSADEDDSDINSSEDEDEVHYRNKSKLDVESKKTDSIINNKNFSNLNLKFGDSNGEKIHNNLPKTPIPTKKKKKEPRSRYMEEFDTNDFTTKSPDNRNIKFENLIEEQLIKRMDVKLDSAEDNKFELPTRLKFSDQLQSKMDGKKPNQLPKTPAPLHTQNQNQTLTQRSQSKSSDSAVDEENLNSKFYTSFNLNLNNSKMILRRRSTKENIHTTATDADDDEFGKFKFETTLNHDKTNSPMAQMNLSSINGSPLNLSMNNSPLSNGNQNDLFSVY